MWFILALGLCAAIAAAAFTATLASSGALNPDTARHLAFLALAAGSALAALASWATWNLANRCRRAESTLHDLRQKADSLGASEARFHALMENSFDIILVLNPDLSARYISPSFDRLLGGRRPPEMSPLQIIHPDDRSIIQQAQLEVIRSPNIPCRVPSYRILRLDGDVRHVEAIGTNCLDIRGVEGIVVNIRDITDRKRAEEELVASQQLLASIATNISEAIFRASPQQGILYANLAFARLFSYPTPADALGTPAQSLFADPDRHHALLRELSVHTVIPNQEIEFRRPDSFPFWGLASCVAIRDNKGVLTAYDFVIIDITQRKHAEEETRLLNRNLEHRVAERTAELTAANTLLRQEARAREKAEAELRAALVTERELHLLKSNFISMVTHEYRTPLGIILSSAELLHGYLDRLPPERRQALLHHIIEASARMSDLLEKVLLLSRCESGSVEIAPASFDVQTLCDKIKTETEAATNHRCHIQFECGTAPRDTVADENLLRHILGNLLNNAVKYSPPGSTVRFTLRSQGESAVFEVTDNGMGIAPEDQARLFTSFHRGQNVANIPGTGLGLVVVKRCVDLLGGSLALNSTLHQGTTVTVTLPAASAQSTASSPLLTNRTRP